MRFLFTTFGVACGIFAALLYWWRPAPALFSITPFDWAARYEKQHVPAEHPWGAMEMGKEMIRTWQPHLPFTEFMHEQTQDRLSRVESDPWREWAALHYSGEGNETTPAVFLRPTDPLAADLPVTWGYIELRDGDRIDFFRYTRLEASELGGKQIPPALRYPYRMPAAVMFAVTLAVMAVLRFRSGADTRVSKSSAGKGSKAFIFIFAGGAVLMVLPFLYGWVNDSPPYVFLGGFIVMCGLIGLAMFGRQVAMVSNMIRGKNVLAHWTYAPEEWQRFAQWAFTAEREEKRGVLRLVSLIILFVGGGFWLVIRDEAAGWVFVFLLGLIVFLWLLVLILPRLTYRRDSRGPGEVFIGPSGIYLNGSVHSWAFPGSRFESAEYRFSPFPMLSITYSYLMTAGRSLYVYRQAAVVSLPVPAGKAVEANAIIEKHFEKTGLDGVAS